MKNIITILVLCTLMYSCTTEQPKEVKPLIDTTIIKVDTLNVDSLKK